MPVARRMSLAEAKACLAVANAAPVIPSRCVTVVKIDARRPGGMNAATTITSGKNETNALPAKATPRSTNSISSSRSHTCHNRVRSARPRTMSTRPRACSDPRVGRPAFGAHPIIRSAEGVARGILAARRAPCSHLGARLSRRPA